MNHWQQNSSQSDTRTSRLYWLLRIFIVIALIIALNWGWRLLHNPRVMPIKSVKMMATYQHLDQPTLQNIITPFIADNGLFSIDVNKLKQVLLQQPWVYSVQVKRVWPDQIEIDLVEQQAAALWNSNALLNPQGQEFTPTTKNFPNNLPALRGPEGQQQQVLVQYQQFNSALVPLGLAIAELDLNTRGSWQMVLTNGMKIILGRTDIEQRFNRFVEAYPKILASNSQNVINVDLRYADGLAVQWRAQLPANSQTISNQGSSRYE